MPSRVNPASSFEAQLPTTERNPLPFTVSLFFHTILIMAILLATKKLHEKQQEEAKHTPAAPNREVQMIYVPPPPVQRPPTPEPRPQPAPVRPVPPPASVITPPEENPNAPPEAKPKEGPEEGKPQEIAQAEEPEGDPEGKTDPTPNPAPVDPAQALNASMEAEAQRIFGRRRGGADPDAGPIATRPFENAKVPDSPCPDIPRDSTGKPVEGLVRGRVVDQETGRALSNAHLQMIDHPFNTFADENGYFTLRFDLMLMANCRTQYVRIESIGHRAQTLPIVMGGGISTVPLRRR